MFKNFWKLIRQESYIEFLREELDKVRSERNALQDTLHHVLRIHLIPKDLEQVRNAAPQSIPISRARNMRTFLSEAQKKSFDEATRKRIEQTENEIQDSESVISELEKEVVNDKAY